MYGGTEAPTSTVLPDPAHCYDTSVRPPPFPHLEARCESYLCVTVSTSHIALSIDHWFTG